jgi:hypothetical protein
VEIGGYCASARQPANRNAAPLLRSAAGRLDTELAGVARRVAELLQRLPGDINPVSLEELRRVKAALVELEDKADNLR